MKKALLLFSLLSGFSLQTFAADSAKDLLKASDRARGGIAGGVTWNAKITTLEDGESSTRSFSIKAQGNDAYVEALSPARNKAEPMSLRRPTLQRTRPSSGRQECWQKKSSPKIRCYNAENI